MHRSRPTPTATAAPAVGARALGLTATATRAEGYVIGAGSWPCAEIDEIMAGGDPSLVGQVRGMLGVWTAASFSRGAAFFDTVEQVGGRTILVGTVQECRTAPPENFLYTVVNSMISNTK